MGNFSRHMKHDRHARIDSEAEAFPEPAEIGQELQRLEPRILALWEEQVRESIPSLHGLKSFTIRNSVPQILRQVSRALIHSDVRFIYTEIPADSERHAKARLRIPDYSFEQLALENKILRKVIFESLEADWPLPADAREIILDILSDSLCRSQSEFGFAQREKEVQLRKEAELAHERYLDVVNHLSHAIAWVADAKTARFAFVAKNAEPILGYSVQEWLEDPDFIAHHIHPDDYHGAMKALAEVRETGREQSVDHRMFAKDGREIWFQTSVQLERGPGGAPACFRGLCFDITKLKRTEAENRELLAISERDLDSLREERDMREKFVNTLTHDLRSPLASAKLAAQLLLMEETPEFVRSKAMRIERSIDRIDKMVRDLLDANRIRAGQAIPLKTGPVDLFALAQEVAEELRELRGAEIIVQRNRPVCGNWSKEEIRRVLENLVGNAIKYGSKTDPITVSVSKVNDRAHLSVHNTGNPIPLRDQADLFANFRRGRAAEASGEPGWGIGLTLAKGIVEAHGGWIGVESSYRSGTTFLVELPLEVA